MHTLSKEWVPFYHVNQESIYSKQSREVPNYFPFNIETRHLFLLSLKCSQPKKKNNMS